MRDDADRDPHNAVWRAARQGLQILHLERAARRVRSWRPDELRQRRFHAWLSEADRRDNERMRLLIAGLLAPTDSCVDVGAGYGSLLGDMVRCAPQGRHIAYEPIPDVFRELVHRFPEVDAREVAVADANGESGFLFIENDAGWSALRRYAWQTRHPARIRELRVRTVRLDDDLPPGFVPRLVKIDVNGGEGACLRGAVHTIRMHRPVVIFEHGAAASLANGYSTRDVYELLRDQCDLRVFTLSGEGPLTLAALENAREWNFMARA